MSPDPPAAPARTLFLVPTPIGNLEDITFRAVRILGAVDWIACEDTRHSRKLLDHYDIHRPTISYYRENEHLRAAGLIERLLLGESGALISDAGAPLLSDPGAHLVRQAVAAGITVVPLPGASATVTALMASGVEGPVAWLGFIPSRAGERRRWLEQWADWPGALVVFESPHRIVAALADMEQIFGAERAILIARELTKAHEQLLRGSVAQVRTQVEQAPPRGEYTLVIEPPAAAAKTESAAEIQLTSDMTRDDLKRLARESGVGRSELYRRLQQLRGKI